jgi:ribose transport system substrate-binding protein
MKTFLKTTVAAGLAASFLLSAAIAQDLAPLNSDTEKDRMDW